MSRGETRVRRLKQIGKVFKKCGDSMPKRFFVNGMEINPVNELLLKPTASIGGRIFEIPQIKVQEKETGEIRELSEDEAFSFLVDLDKQGVNIFKYVREI